MNKTKYADPFIIQPAGFAVSFAVRTMPDRLSEVDTDLLVLTMHEHMQFGPGLQELDAACAGAITKGMADCQFAGALGDSVLISLPDAKTRNVLIVGLGNDRDIGRFSYCGFIGLWLDRAKKVNAKRVTLPFSPGRLTSINLMGMLAVLKCRVQQVSLSSSPADLSTIEILCSPQAKPWIIEGLSIDKP